MKTLSLLLLLACGAIHFSRAADVNVYAITKTRGYQQTSPAPAVPAPLVTGGFTFAAIITPTTTTPASVASATLTPPAAAATSFGPVPGFGPFAVVAAFNTQTALDAAYGDGSYLFTMQTVNDGTRSPSLSISGSDYPNIPTIANFTAAQNIDWTQPFTLQWAALAGGSAQDSIQLIISRKNGTRLFATPQFGNPGALNGTATSVVIPANTFVPGQSYSATLIFGNIIAVDPVSYGAAPPPIVAGVNAFAATTDFPMKAPGTTPVLVISKGTLPDSFDLSWNADIGRTYDLVWSPDLVGWTRLFLVTAGMTNEKRSDTPALGVTKRFYRLQEPP